MHRTGPKGRDFSSKKGPIEEFLETPILGPEKLTF
jgi:hypothetical protein